MLTKVRELPSGLDKEVVRTALERFIGQENYPCVAAKSVVSRDALTVETGRDITRCTDDVALYRALQQFLPSSASRDTADAHPFQTFVMAYDGPSRLDERAFENALWDRLQNLHNFDAVLGIPWNEDVSANPDSPEFSMSIGGRAFFIVGLHPRASRPARQFGYPALVFNLHEQFEELRAQDKYDRMKSVIRERDKRVAGTINPMLSDFGHHSEAVQYSGRMVSDAWRCPFSPQSGRPEMSDGT